VYNPQKGGEPVTEWLIAVPPALGLAAAIVLAFALGYRGL
jgi:hypothetical protein